MGRKRITEFSESAFDNNATYRQYLDRLTELAMSMFEWINMPSTVDIRFLELSLFMQGTAVFFKEPELGAYCALRCVPAGKLDMYGIPVKRYGYGQNGYKTPELDNYNSVIIYNNILRTNSVNAVRNYAKRLYNLDRIIDVNANAQKTPVLITCDDTQKLTMLNTYKEWEGNAPVIFAKRGLNPNDVRVLKTDAPYLGDKIYTLKTQIWNEALTYLGISNVNIGKRERLVTDEVLRNQGGVIASRYPRLQTRQEACKKINELFGLNIWCKYREDFQTIDETDILKDEYTENSEVEYE